MQNLFNVIFKTKMNFPSLFPVGLKLGNFAFLYKKKIKSQLLTNNLIE